MLIYQLVYQYIFLYVDFLILVFSLLEATEESSEGQDSHSIIISCDFYSYQILTVNKYDKNLACTSVNTDFHFTVLFKHPENPPSSKDRKALLVVS